MHSAQGYAPVLYWISCYRVDNMDAGDIPAFWAEAAPQHPRFAIRSPGQPAAARNLSKTQEPPRGNQPLLSSPIPNRAPEKVPDLPCPEMPLKTPSPSVLKYRRPSGPPVGACVSKLTEAPPIGDPDSSTTFPVTSARHWPSSGCASRTIPKIGKHTLRIDASSYGPNAVPMGIAVALGGLTYPFMSLLVV